MIQNDRIVSGGKSPSYVLVGDTGEKDEEAGERIISKHGKSIRAVFLHTVSDSRDRSTVDLPSDRIYEGIPIYYFRTYVGAASKACSGGLITASALKRVIVEAENDLSAVETKKPKPLGMIRGAFPSKMNIVLNQSRRTELEADIAQALKTNKISYKFGEMKVADGFIASKKKNYY